MERFPMRADLNWDQSGDQSACRRRFREHPTQALSYKTMWHVNAAALTSRDAHSGKIACRFSNTNSGQWQDVCAQTVSLQNADYSIEVLGEIEEVLPPRVPSVSESD
ncbi:MAG: hypothetical protein ACLSGF_06345 [Alistipes onderdonkii]